MIRLAMVLVLLAAGGARAASLAGVTLPDVYPVEGQNLVLNGIGLRTLTIFNVRAYVAGLYVAAKTGDAQTILNARTPKVLLLQYLHSASKAQVEKQYRAGEMTNCGDGSCAAADAADFERLVAAAPGVEPGDTTTFIFTARGVRVLANNRVIADLANTDLAFHLLAGFIGAKPPSPELRSHLLGAPN